MPVPRLFIDIEALPAGAEAWVCDMRLDIRHVRVTQTHIVLRSEGPRVTYDLEGIDGFTDPDFPDRPRPIWWSGQITSETIYTTEEEAFAARKARLEMFRGA